LRTGQCLKEVYFQDGFSAVEMTEAFFTERRHATGKSVNPNKIKHTVTTLADTSSSGGSEMRWMSLDEGSDRRSRSLVGSSVMGVKDARMTFVKEERWVYENSQELMNALLVKLSRIMSVVL